MGKGSMRCHMIGRVCLRQWAYIQQVALELVQEKGARTSLSSIFSTSRARQCLDKLAIVRGNRFIATWIIL